MQHRHILPKEDVRKWPHPRESTQQSYYSHKPVMAFPPYHSAHVLPGGQVYPAWVPPSSYPAGAQIWGSPYYPAWQSTESWHWKPSPEVKLAFLETRNTSVLAKKVLFFDYFLHVVESCSI